MCCIVTACQQLWFLLLQFNSTTPSETDRIEFCQGECPPIFRGFFSRCSDASNSSEAIAGLNESKHYYQWYSCMMPWEWRNDGRGEMMGEGKWWERGNDGRGELMGEEKWWERGEGKWWERGTDGRGEVMGEGKWWERGRGEVMGEGNWWERGNDGRGEVMGEGKW
jgi:hypothetical protein